MQILRQDIGDAKGGLWRLAPGPKPMANVRHFELPDGRVGLEAPRSWFISVREPNKLKLVG